MIEKIVVIEEKLKKDKNGEDFANVKLEDGRYVNFMFDNFQAYEGPGEYQAEINKNGRFWNVEQGSLELMSKSNGEPKDNPINSTNDSGIKGALSMPQMSLKQSDTNKSILVQVCIKSAAEVFHSAGAETEPANRFIQDQLIAVANKFYDWANEKLNG